MHRILLNKWEYEIRNSFFIEQILDPFLELLHRHLGHLVPADGRFEVLANLLLPHDAQFRLYCFADELSCIFSPMACSLLHELGGVFDSFHCRWVGIPAINDLNLGRELPIITDERFERTVESYRQPLINGNQLIHQFVPLLVGRNISFLRQKFCHDVFENTKAA